MNVVERAKRLLLTPGPEWQVIDTEPTTTGDLYRQYIIPLALIGPIARVIGFSLIGIHVPFSGVTYRTPIARALVGALVSYVLALVGVYVLAMIIDMLAPTFGGTTNRIQALKVAAYSSTAAWLAAVFAIVPGLSILMKSPSDKAGAYTVVVVLVAIVLFMLIGVVGSRVMMGGMY